MKVVSREAPMVWIFEVDEGEGDHEIEFVRKVDYDDAMALPQPVAPVQSGGVEEIDRICSELDKTDWSQFSAVEAGLKAGLSRINLDSIIGAYRAGGMVGQCPSFHDLKKIVAHLTTTQSAPSVPSVEEIDEAFDRGWYSIIGNEGEENEREQEAFQAGLRAVHALLTERQGGKA